jgi:AcrR family transcriptional regulator
MAVKNKLMPAKSATTRADKPGGKREQNKRANQTAILDAARKCFLLHGYESVTIRDVIRQTGLASGTFYNYFQEKAELLQALIEGQMHLLTQRLIGARRNATSIEDFLYSAYLSAFEEFASQPAFYAMMFRNEPIIRSLYGDKAFGYTISALKRDLRLAMARGLLPEMDADYLAAILFGSGYEVARMMVERKGKKPAEAAEFCTRVFLAGIGHRPTPLLRRGSITHQGSAR